MQNIPVAIIGMGCFFPKSSSLKDYWRLIYHGIDGITDVPETHWPPEDYFDQDPQKPDYIYCKRGGFLYPEPFDPVEFGIPPSSLEATDSTQLLGLVAAKMALYDSGYLNGKPFNRNKTSVILGVTGTQELVIPLGARLGHPIWKKALKESGISKEKTEEVVKRISDSYVSWQENSFPGLLGNVVAGRISNRLDLGGTNCVVDAACASSMSAVHLAVMELQSGRSDMVITGGADTLNDVFMHMCFSKTKTLSPTGDARPFSKDADGTVLGEGIGMIILKRLNDAQKDGDRIYAVIKGIGSSSDGRSQSIYAPRREGQEKALFAAYKNADLNPDTVELIEAHGTGTRVGDTVEFNALKNIFNGSSDNRCALGSVKSMIGHTKAAAGAAGIIKTALCLFNKVLPPSIKAKTPDPKLEINKTRFYINTEANPWFSRKEHPRRAGVSAFGFGGSNFHLVLEEYKNKKEDISWDGSVEIIPFSAPDKKGIEKLLNDFKNSIEFPPTHKELSIKAKKARSKFSYKDRCRLLIVYEKPVDPQEISAHITRLFSDAADGLNANIGKDFWNLPNIYFGQNHKPQKTALIFPGQGSQYLNMGRDLVCTFPDAFDVIEQVNFKLDNAQRLSDLIYPAQARTEEEKQNQKEKLLQTEIAQPAIGAVSAGMLKVLQYFGVKPEAVCGHSYGELTALFAAGWIDFDTFFSLSVSRGRFMAGCNKGAMLAVNAPADELESIIKNIPGLVLANRNTHSQNVLSGHKKAVFAGERICKEKGYNTVLLPVSAAFHSDLMADAQKAFKQLIQDADITPTDIPVFSNTTAEPYPANADEAKKLLGSQILSPVDFVSEIENMYNHGVRIFIETGPKSVLTGLVKSILKGKDFHAIAIDSSNGSRFAMPDLARALCSLASVGYNLSISRWEKQDLEIRNQIMKIPISGTNYRMKKKKNFSKDVSNVENRIEKTVTHKQNGLISDVLKVVQEGLKSMQALQTQTAKTHEKFLETQAEASRTLRKMMESTRRLTESLNGENKGKTISSHRINLEQKPSIEPAADILPEIPDTKKEPEIIPDNTGRIKEIENNILTVVSDLTGYPKEMLGLDMEIEADLGIDSIKRVEIFSALEEQIDNIPSVSPENIASLKTLRQIVNYLSKAPETKTEQNIQKPYLSDSFDDIIKVNDKEIDITDEINRQIVSVTEQPLNPGKRISIPYDREVLITDNNTELAKAIVDEFKRQSINASLIDIKSINNGHSLPKVCGLVMLYDDRKNESFLKDAFLLTKTFANDLIESAGKSGALFATITGLDGAFGFKGNGVSNPIQGGLAGFPKTASVEWENVICRAIDIAPEWKESEKIAKAVVSELLNADFFAPVEIGLCEKSRFVINLKSAPIKDKPNKFMIDKDEVFVITGGAKGITAACAHALAKEAKPKLVLLGRSSRPFTEPDWLAAVEDEASTKKAILEHEKPKSPAELEKVYKKYISNREISENITRLKAAGAETHYFQVDVRNTSEVVSVFDKIRANLGPIKGIIHGAGILNDSLIVDKKIEQFEEVLNTKVKGLESVLKASKDDDLKYLILFSSVTARYGNIGQLDYAVANEVLNKTAQQEAFIRPSCKVVSINWGPWDGGMVSPILKREFAQKGITLIPVNAGAKCLLYEMSEDTDSSVEIVIESNINHEKKSAIKTDLSAAIKHEIDIESYPVLNSHILGGKPVVPFALMTEWLGHSALHENPGFFLYGIDDMRLLNGIKLDSEKKMIRLFAGKAKRDGSVYKVDVEIRDGIKKDGTDLIHSKAKAILTDSPQYHKQSIQQDFKDFKSYTKTLDEVYDKILFHGEKLRGISKIITCSPNIMIADLCSAPSPANWIAAPFRSRWIADPLVLDSAFQMATLWCYEEKGLVSLPSYCASYRQYRKNFPPDGVTAILEIKDVTNRKMKGDFTFIDKESKVVARLTGYESVMDPSLYRAFKPQYAADE